MDRNFQPLYGRCFSEEHQFSLDQDTWDGFVIDYAYRRVMLDHHSFSNFKWTIWKN